MADLLRLSDGNVPSSPLHRTQRLREDIDKSEQQHHASISRGSTSSIAVGDREGDDEAGWYSAIPNPPHQAPAPHGTHLPTPRSFGSDNTFPFFPTAVGSPESPLINARSRLMGATSSTGLTSKIPTCPDSSAYNEPQRPSKSAMHPQAITPRASPVASPNSLPARPLSLPLLSSSSHEPPRVFVKTESPPPVLVPAQNISFPRSSTSQAASSETRSIEIGLSSPFVEKAKPVAIHSGARLGERFHLRPTDSPSSNPIQPTVLSSPAHIEEKHHQPVSQPSTSVDPEGPTRKPGGELNRIRNHLMEVEETRKAELESRRPDYLKRLQHGEDAGPSVPSLPDNKPIENDAVGIMETPARGRRIQLFDFQETSAESFEESLMTHGYGTYGEPRTPARPLAATEGLSKEAMDWLTYNTPAAVPGSAHSNLVPDAELNEKELKKRKRLEAFRGSTARAYAKLYPAEVEGLGRVLLNVPPEEVDELASSPAKKRATGKRKRGGAAAAEKRGKLLRASTPVHPEATEPHWLDKEIPWCLREKEREEEMKARDAERMKWIDSYFAHDTTDEDSDKNEDDGASPTWGQETEEPPEPSKRGRGKAVPLQANPTHMAREETTAGNKGRSLFFPTDPADARTALMSKRSVRLLAQRKLRQNGQRPASLRGYREGKLACSCGVDDDEDDGRPAVQCDDCYNWHHLECIGVRDEAELGAKEDPWFCPVCTAQADAAFSAADWRNQRQPTFVPTDDRPVHTSTKSDVAFYSSSPLREWGSSGTLNTPVQGQGRLHSISGMGVNSSESFRRSIWDDPHTSPGPLTPVTASLSSRGVHITTPSGSSGRGHGGVGGGGFDPLISPRFPKFGFGTSSFMTPKNNVGSAGGGASSGFGLPWPPHSSGGLFATPTPRGRGNSGGYGLAYDSGDPISSSSRAAANDTMYATDDTPIRRAPVKETRTLGMYPPSESLLDSPLAGRGQGSAPAPLDGRR